MAKRRFFSQQEVIEYLDIPDNSGSEDDEEDNSDSESEDVDPERSDPRRVSSNEETQCDPDNRAGDSFDRLSLHSESDEEFSADSETDSPDDEIASDDEDLHWKKKESPQSATMLNLDFDDKPLEPNHQFSKTDTASAYFYRFFHKEVIDSIVEQTNLYASQKKLKYWTDVTDKELTAFIGMLILMGLHRQPSLPLYCSTEPLYFVKPVAEVMPIKRLKKILQSLHLNDNSMAPGRTDPSFDKLYKVRPLITALNNKFQSEASPSKSHSIDECMIPFKGLSSLKQYMPMKPIKRGYKVWARADSKYGYLYQFEIYTGKTDTGTKEGLASNIVQRLSASLHGTFAHVTFDNFFSSPALMETLYSRNIYATATVRTNRKGLPLIAQNKKKMKKVFFKWLVGDNVGFAQLQDTKLVNVLSTAYFPNIELDVMRIQKDGSRISIKCPQPVAQYTRRMGVLSNLTKRYLFMKLVESQNGGGYESSISCWILLL